METKEKKRNMERRLRKSTENANQSSGRFLRVVYSLTSLKEQKHMVCFAMTCVSAHTQLVDSRRYQSNNAEVALHHTQFFPACDFQEIRNKLSPQLNKISQHMNILRKRSFSKRKGWASGFKLCVSLT